MTMESKLASRSIAVLAMVVLLTGCGITAPRSNAGFANLDAPGIKDTDRTMALSIGPTTMRFAALFLDDEPEIQTLLRSLDGVRVRIYEVHGGMQRINRKFLHMGDRLNENGWKPVVLVHEEDELVQMYVKSSGTDIHGLTVFSADDEEVVVVNLMGDIDPVYYTDVMQALEVDDAPQVKVALAN